jgi:hypothetical protein
MMIKREERKEMIKYKARSSLLLTNDPKRLLNYSIQTPVRMKTIIFPLKAVIMTTEEEAKNNKGKDKLLETTQMKT